MPDILTREDFYTRLHRELPEAPALLSEFEREVLVRRAARLASAAGVPAPFRLRAGLIVEMLALYDELRRHGRTIDQFERLMIESLEPGADSDRGAERLLRQTRFLVAVFRELERRVAATGRLDEHGLRARLIAATNAGPYTRVILTIADQSADPCGCGAPITTCCRRCPAFTTSTRSQPSRCWRPGYTSVCTTCFPGSRRYAWSPRPRRR